MTELSDDGLLRTVPVGDITGDFFVAAYQRGYRWGEHEVLQLLDDIRDSNGATYYLQPIVVKGRDDGSWELIDGQQRVITLARAMAGDEGIDVVFNPDEPEFQLANAATKRDPSWIRVAEVWDDDAYRRLRRQLDGDRRADSKIVVLGEADYFTIVV